MMAITGKVAEIRDPGTNEILGSVDHTKVEVVSAQKRLSVCRTFRKVTIPSRPGKPGLATSPFSSLSQTVRSKPL